MTSIALIAMTLGRVVCNAPNDDADAKKSFEALVAALPSALKGTPFANIMTREKGGKTGELYALIRIARMTSATTAKITVTTQIGKSDEIQLHLSFVLQYYDKKWTVQSHSGSTWFYGERDYRHDELLQMVIRIDELSNSR